MCFCCFSNRECTIISSIINLFVAITGSVTFLAKPNDIAIKMPYEFKITFGILFIIISIIFIYGIIASFVAITTIIYMFTSKQLAIERCNNEFKTETEPPKNNCVRKVSIITWLRTILLILMVIIGLHTFEITRRLGVDLRPRRKKPQGRNRPQSFISTANFMFI
ncbi:unnamed protein product [Rhizophagus irregularis]|uniref:Uncharacterized protein n=1 Tax=Rhizophagus irregularis TaxID=588596 RepID=A0A915ZM63_9GLOM|nr:unnamed protein product [Rhizophagus irregularis]CAB5383144.1 unnamed protein product [Rhizophagus irregularis]